MIYNTYIFQKVLRHMVFGFIISGSNRKGRSACIAPEVQSFQTYFLENSEIFTTFFLNFYNFERNSKVFYVFYYGLSELC